MVDLRENKLIFLRWEDHISIDAWRDPKKDAPELLDCITVGFLINETDKYIEVASTVEDVNCCCSMVILKNCILERKEVAIVQNDIPEDLTESITNL